MAVKKVFIHGYITRIGCQSGRLVNTIGLNTGEFAQYFDTYEKAEIAAVERVEQFGEENIIILPTFIKEKGGL